MKQLIKAYKFQIESASTQLLRSGIETTHGYIYNPLTDKQTIEFYNKALF
jgi:hypothetical protein